MTNNEKTFKKEYSSLLGASLDRRKIPALDGLRAVSVFLVIFYHFGFTWVPGHYGVVMFFVLSGFLITWILLHENDTTGTVSLRQFYWRRLLRIFPAFYAFWFLCIGVLLIQQREINWLHSWSAFTYWSNYYNAIYGDPSNELSHTWSLSIEEQFYLLWPFFFLSFRRRPRKLIYATGCIILVIWLYRMVLTYGYGVQQSYIYSAFDTRIDALLVGCFLAMVLHQRRWIPFIGILVKNQTFAIFPIVIIAFSLFLEASATIPRYRDVVGFTIVPPLMAVLIVQLIAMHQMTLWRWTEWSWVCYLGRISYPLYLYQQITLYPVRTYLEGPLLVKLICAISVTIFLASASYHVIERPFLKLKNCKV
jgi:peptidoglycan/LPS O-acetylase OafA/YrhL